MRIAAVIIALLAAGCAQMEMDSRIKREQQLAEYERKRAEDDAKWKALEAAEKEAFKADCKKRPFHVGMTAAQARNTCLGKPDVLSHLVTANGTSEVWEFFRPGNYVGVIAYLRDGIVVGFKYPQ